MNVALGLPSILLQLLLPTILSRAWASYLVNRTTQLVDEVVNSVSSSSIFRLDAAPTLPIRLTCSA